MHLYSTLLYMTNAPTAYAVFGAQLGMDWAKDESDARHSARARLGRTRDLRTIRSSPFTLVRKGHLPARAQIGGNYKQRIVLINFIKGQRGWCTDGRGESGQATGEGQPHFKAGRPSRQQTTAYSADQPGLS